MKNTGDIDKTNELLKGRHELAIGRIRQLVEEPEVPELYQECFCGMADFLELADTILEKKESWTGASMEELAGLHDILFGDIRTENYAKSYANPTYATEKFGERAGQLLCLLKTELYTGLGFVFEEEEELWVSVLELFIEIHGCFCEEEPDLQEANQTIYWYFHDYSEIIEMRRVRYMTCPEENLYKRIIMESNFSDLRYLYRYGLPIGKNEIETARFLAKLPQETIQKMADTFTEGYRKGYEATRKDITKKKAVPIYYPIGFERVVRAAIQNFEELGLSAVIDRQPTSSYVGIGQQRGAYSTSFNRQFLYDHKEDRAFYFDKRFADHCLDMLRKAFEYYKEDAAALGGPAVLEVFGEEPFSPEVKKCAVYYSIGQQNLVVYHMGMISQLTNEYIPQDESSFTIIAFPSPQIGADFEAVFDETVRINTLDSLEYTKIQKHLIDAMDGADYIHILGQNGNRTDLKVKLHPLDKPEEQTDFENCVADVNIPVGEVFTTPVLEGTEGILHVSEVFLNGLRYQDLEIRFEEGMTKEYTCGNFEDPDQAGNYIYENAMRYHRELPMGEFAIGTNTAAYVMGRRFGITDRLPILIAEKTGPHFALGDTCYSFTEDIAVYNPDGKEIIARENTKSALRTEAPQFAYFNCHTDITIPYAELASIRACFSDGKETDILINGRYVVPGTEILNEPLDAYENV